MQYYSPKLLEQACVQLQLPILQLNSARITNDSASYAWSLSDVYQLYLVLSFYPDGSNSLVYCTINDDVAVPTVTYTASSLQELTRKYHELMSNEILSVTT